MKVSSIVLILVSLAGLAAGARGGAPRAVGLSTAQRKHVENQLASQLEGRITIGRLARLQGLRAVYVDGTVARDRLSLSNGAYPPPRLAEYDTSHRYFQRVIELDRAR